MAIAKAGEDAERTQEREVLVLGELSQSFNGASRPRVRSPGGWLGGFLEQLFDAAVDALSYL